MDSSGMPMVAPPCGRPSAAGTACWPGAHAQACSRTAPPAPSTQHPAGSTQLAHRVQSIHQQVSIKHGLVRRGRRQRLAPLPHRRRRRRRQHALPAAAPPPLARRVAAYRVSEPRRARRRRRCPVRPCRARACRRRYCQRIGGQQQRGRRRAGELLPRRLHDRRQAAAAAAAVAGPCQLRCHASQHHPGARHGCVEGRELRDGAGVRDRYERRTDGGLAASREAWPGCA